MVQHRDEAPEVKRGGTYPGDQRSDGQIRRDRQKALYDRQMERQRIAEHERLLVETSPNVIPIDRARRNAA